MCTDGRFFLVFALCGILTGAASAQAPTPAPGRWSQGAAMPSSRTEVAVAEVNGKIYVVGGFGGERELEIYDPATDRWSRGASFPREVHHAAAVGVDGKLYVVDDYAKGQVPLALQMAGRDEVFVGRVRRDPTIPHGLNLWVVADNLRKGAPTNAVYEYSPAEDRWRSRAPMPTPRGSLAAAAIDGRIHAVGGVGGTGRVGRRNNSDAHEVYDPAADKWLTRAPLPTPRDHLAAAA